MREASFQERVSTVNEPTELWEHALAVDDNAGAPDWEPRFVWKRHAVVKITPKRIYTEPYQSAQLWGREEVQPYFDREALNRDGSACHRTKPAGGNPCYLELYLKPTHGTECGE